ncbi:MAG: hypothetical protein NZ898_08390, partial [Myxococcota bacterium]|nr:hypothetical protein [Myxococcota bacterium]
QPLVLVATPEPTRAEELARLLQGRAQVEPLPDLDVVPHVLAASVASAVVLDCGAASLESSDVQQLAASASPACRLLLWGASPELESAFHLAGARDVVGCAPGASARHVARMLAALLDAS